ncbi:hypothetical protein LCGC14_2412970 [marine sediment metagenome]|uniref:Uncharacterized protein n=1 Tax=marine sediment metagenome TaxID=412755 RepID=A0A0F9ELB1_9ZZZZ
MCNSKHRGKYTGDQCECGEWRSSPVHFSCDKIGHDWDWDNKCVVCGVEAKDESV